MENLYGVYIHTNSKGNPLVEGLYRDKKDKSYILYLSVENSKWKFQTPGVESAANFPLTMSKEIELIGEPIEEIERFRKIIGFLEKKLGEEVESRRDV